MDFGSSEDEMSDLEPVDGEWTVNSITSAQSRSESLTALELDSHHRTGVDAIDLDRVRVNQNIEPGSGLITAFAPMPFREDDIEFAFVVSPELQASIESGVFPMRPRSEGYLTSRPGESPEFSDLYRNHRSDTEFGERMLQNLNRFLASPNSPNIGYNSTIIMRPEGSPSGFRPLTTEQLQQIEQMGGVVHEPVNRENGTSRIVPSSIPAENVQHLSYTQLHQRATMGLNSSTNAEILSDITASDESLPTINPRSNIGDRTDDLDLISDRESTRRSDRLPHYEHVIIYNSPNTYSNFLERNLIYTPQSGSRQSLVIQRTEPTIPDGVYNTVSGTWAPLNNLSNRSTESTIPGGVHNISSSNNAQVVNNSSTEPTIFELSYTTLLKQLYEIPFEMPKFLILNGLHVKFIPFEEAAKMLSKHKIERYIIDPILQPWAGKTDSLNRIVTLFGKNGITYLVKARYDQPTNQIFSPV